VRDHRFDVAVRALAGRASRRGALRGLAVSALTVLSAVRGTDTAANHGHIPIGGACRQTSQCVDHAVTSRHHRARPAINAVYCEENGFRYDGRYNCCRHQGGSCQRDEHCCGSRHFCRNRVCTYLR
jgi:hypothetical protein